MSVGKHSTKSWKRRLPIVLGIALLVLAIAMAGTALAAYRYDRSNVGRILPGVRIEGVEVGGMTRTDAIAAVGAVTDARLGQQLQVKAGKQSWQLTPAQLGVTADVGAAVDHALSLSASYSWVDRTLRRLSDDPIGASIDVQYAFSRAASQDFVKRAEGSVLRAPVDASVSIGKTGAVVFRRAKPGVELDTGAAVRDIHAALDNQQSSVILPLKKVQPKVTNQDVGKTIVVNVTTNRLWLYDGFKVEKTYPVATAAPGYTTPLGTWHVINKAKDPTWINPAPNGWGAGEPKIIPPGPGNPIGTRALYLDSPGILIHGTPEAASIGSHASHGCIRMLIPDSEQLYPLVPIGTPVLIVNR